MAQKTVSPDVPPRFLKQLNSVWWSRATPQDVAEAVQRLEEGIVKYGVPLKEQHPDYHPANAGQKLVKNDVPQEILSVYNRIAWGLISKFNLSLLYQGLTWVIKKHVAQRVPLRAT